MSTLLGFSYLISGLVEMILPVVLGLYIKKRFNVSWNYYILGCGMFMLSLIRMPFNTFIHSSIGLYFPVYEYILTAFIPSLTAGIFEESARYLAFKYWIKDRTTENVLMYGAGHGGIESILLVGLNVFAVGILLLFNPASIPAEQLSLIVDIPVYMPLLGLYERVMTLIIHVGLSVVVLQAYLKNSKRYLGYAILIHTAVNFTAVLLVKFNPILAELSITVFAVILGKYTFDRIRASAL